ncbi:MAG: hypothetical protein ACRBFS_03220 [Aureispira sp.]
MKRCILFFFLFTLQSALFAQKGFCDGWKVGYEQGKASLEQTIFIVPICPIVVNGDNYDNGYAAGFEKATGQKITALATPTPQKASFCEGWKKGYANAMNATKRSTFITPICPIAPINEDNYDAGYIKGYTKAKKEQGMPVEDLVPTKTEGGYCDGWERGYQTGLQLWAEENNKRKPLRITPICPIAPIQKDRYADAFARGKARAFKDMK